MSVSPAAGVGAGLGVVLAGILVAALKKYAGYDMTTTDATSIATAMLLGVGGFAHVLWTVGLVPLLRRLLFGPSKQ